MATDFQWIFKEQFPFKTGSHHFRSNENIIFNFWSNDNIILKKRFSISIEIVRTFFFIEVFWFTFWSKMMGKNWRVFELRPRSWIVSVRCFICRFSPVTRSSNHRFVDSESFRKISFTPTSIYCEVSDVHQRPIRNLHICSCFAAVLLALSFLLNANEFVANIPPLTWCEHH